MATGIPLINKVELVLRRDRSADWFATTKVPLVDAGGAVIGIEGICRHLKKAKVPAKAPLAFPDVLEYIMEYYHEKIDVPDLAAMASLSVKQFERRFKREYGMLPARYIQRIRLDAACQLLAVTDFPVARIGTETGFYDNSHFSRLFARYTGLSPKAFREKHRQPPA
jgi:transcriptional regulator GlxA family with amidase domain